MDAVLWSGEMLWGMKYTEEEAGWIKTSMIVVGRSRGMLGVEVKVCVTTKSGKCTGSSPPVQARRSGNGLVLPRASHGSWRGVGKHRALLKCCYKRTQSNNYARPTQPAKPKRTADGFVG